MNDASLNSVLFLLFPNILNHCWKMASRYIAYGNKMLFLFFFQETRNLNYEKVILLENLNTGYSNTVLNFTGSCMVAWWHHLYNFYSNLMIKIPNFLPFKDLLSLQTKTRFNVEHSSVQLQNEKYRYWSFNIYWSLKHMLLFHRS